MKLLYQLSLLLPLAVVALTQAPTVSSPGHVSNLTSSKSNPSFPNIGPGDAVYSYADLLSGPDPDNRYANLTVPVTGWNGDSTVGSYGVIVRMSTEKEHVGEFTLRVKGQHLFDIIKAALLKLCPYERGRIGCYQDMPGTSDPKHDNSLPEVQPYYKKFWVLDVPYKDPNGNYAHNVWLTIAMRGMFRNQQYLGIGEATYELAAGVYARATEHLKNCYTESFNKNSRPYHFCNVPRHILIALPAHEGKVIDTWLSMTMTFEKGKTKYGEFDCYGTMSPVIDFWRYSVLPDVAKSMGTPEDKWKTPCTQCFNEDESFELDTWRDYKRCDYLD